jgi:methylglutamate dehydrogenase subunit D
MADRPRSPSHLAPRSPLQDVARPGRFGKPAGAPGVIIRECVGLALARVEARKGRADDVARVLSQLTGVPVFDRCQRFGRDGVSFTGCAPGQWLGLAADASAQPFAEALTTQLAGVAAVADQSDGLLVLDISGARVRDALEKGVAIDLDPAAFKVGDAAQTLVAHQTVQLCLLDAAPTFQLAFAASLAGSLWSWLETSVAEFGGVFERG